jgi:hypothetical protein
MLNRLKRRLAKVEKRLNQIDGNCEFTIVFNPPKQEKSEIGGRSGEDQRCVSEQAKSPITKQVPEF